MMVTMKVMVSDGNVCNKKNNEDDVGVAVEDGENELKIPVANQIGARFGSPQPNKISEIQNKVLCPTNQMEFR